MILTGQRILRLEPQQKVVVTSLESTTLASTLGTVTDVIPEVPAVKIRSRHGPELLFNVLGSREPWRDSIVYEATHMGHKVEILILYSEEPANESPVNKGPKP